MECSWKVPELDDCFRTDKLWKETIPAVSWVKFLSLAQILIVLSPVGGTVQLCGKVGPCWKAWDTGVWASMFQKSMSF